MAFKDRIKQARLNNKLTQEQLAEKIGVAKSTLAGYEKGNREPNLETTIKIMTALNIDANYLWQDEMDFPIKVSYEEMEHIEKYRDLDPHGKEMVDFVLDREHERSIDIKDTKDNIVEMSQHLEINAACPDENSTPEERTSDDAMMADDSEWK